LENHVKFKKELVLIEDQYLQKKELKDVNGHKNQKHKDKFIVVNLQLIVKLITKQKLKKMFKKRKTMSLDWKNNSIKKN